jgi:hypothetical protein
VSPIAAMTVRSQPSSELSEQLNPKQLSAVVMRWS